MKAATFIITALANIGIGFVLFFVLLLSLNGFAGGEAAPGLILFVLWAALCSLAAAVLSFMSAKYLTEKKFFNPLLAALSAIVFFVVVGAAVNFVGVIAAVFLTSAMR